ncbi:hypothetical protein [Elizabethkingia ursingii]|uniref:hypothetical protein n=1 Tax=Elizabethkingia ursingii TaxID=1756150 RepID=UPI0032C46500
MLISHIVGKPLGFNSKFCSLFSSLRGNVKLSEAAFENKKMRFADFTGSNQIFLFSEFFDPEKGSHFLKLLIVYFNKFVHVGSEDLKHFRIDYK